MDVNDPSMRVVDRHANLCAIGLAQDRWKEQRMLLDFAVLEKSSLEQAALEFLDFKFFQVVDGATGRTLNFKAIVDKLLMQDVQVGRVDRVFHSLKPVAVQLW